MKTKSKIKIQNILWTLGSILFWLVLWYLCALKATSELILPSPVQTGKRLLELIFTSEFNVVCIKSILRIMIGTITGLIAAVLAAIVSSAFKPVDKLLSPLVTAVRATPVASFIVIALLWLGKGILPGFISALMVFPVVYQNVRTGINEVPKEHRKLIKVFELSPARAVRMIYLPSVLPYFFSATITSLGLSWKAGIAAEVLAFTPDSIGRQLSQAKNLLETTDLFAWTAAVIFISLIIEFIFKKIISVLSYKYGKRGEKQ